MVRMGKTRKAVESKKKEKIKTPYAKIIVEGKNDYPYYSIVYYDTEKKEWMNGFGSYNRHYVFDWLKNEFEVTMEADCFPVIHGRWLWHDLKEDGFTTCQGAWTECSNCGFGEIAEYDYCKKCGAKMDLPSIRLKGMD